MACKLAGSGSNTLESDISDSNVLGSDLICVGQSPSWKDLLIGLGA